MLEDAKPVIVPDLSVPWEAVGLVLLEEDPEEEELLEESEEYSFFSEADLEDNGQGSEEDEWETVDETSDSDSEDGGTTWIVNMLDIMEALDMCETPQERSRFLANVQTPDEADVNEVFSFLLH